MSALIDEQFRWLPQQSYDPRPLPIKKPFIAEIKPHTADGVRKGLEQVRGRSVTSQTQRWLVTYEVLAAAKGDSPGRVRVYAYRVYPTRVEGPWNVGESSYPATMKFPSVRHVSMFGMAIEPIVRSVFRRRLPAGTTLVRGTGGARRGVDLASQKELTHLYAELARLTADPFFEELANEFASLSR